MPNGKLLGKWFGDRYPAEEALAQHKLENRHHDWGSDEDWGDKQGPGGRLYAKGQQDQESRILAKFKEPSKVTEEYVDKCPLYNYVFWSSSQTKMVLVPVTRRSPFNLAFQSRNTTSLTPGGSSSPSWAQCYSTSTLTPVSRPPERTCLMSQCQVISEGEAPSPMHAKNNLYPLRDLFLQIRFACCIA